MQLRQFVKSTITDVFSAIMDAQKEMGKNYGNIAPARSGVRREAIDTIEFDVVLASGDQSAESGGIGVWLANLGVGAKAQSSAENSTQTRIRFSVPVLFPDSPNPKTGP
jgi:hypothetical protein